MTTKKLLEDPQMLPTGKFFGMLNEGMTTCSPNKGACCVIPEHQKQTSSQLINFLRSRWKGGALTNLQLVAGRSLPNPTTVAVNGNEIGSKAFHDCKCQGTDGIKKLLSSLASLPPVFKQKQNHTDGMLVYSYVVATECELWDSGDISTNKTYLLYKSDQEERNLLNLESGSDADHSCNSAEVSPRNTSSSIERPLFPKGENVMAQIDCVAKSKMREKVPEFQIRKYEEQEVSITHVVNPANFCIQLVNPQLRQLSLMFALDCSVSFAQMKRTPDAGAHVVGWFPAENLWCRSQVLKICGKQDINNNNIGSQQSMQDIEVEVRRIDYGDTACLPLQNMKELSESAAALPAQSLRVSLANVSPVNGSDWSLEAVSWFKEKVAGRTLYARLFPQETQVMVDLFMEKGKLGAMRRSPSMSVRLAQNGYAKHRMVNRLEKITFPQSRGFC